MKRLLRKQLPSDMAETLRQSRFVRMIPQLFGNPEILAHGNDPNQVNTPTTLEAEHGDLYRIDEE